MKKVFLLFVVLGLIPAFARISYGQSCPDSVPDYPSIHWQSGGCKTVMINECSTEVCWCFRVITVNGVDVRFDYLITDVTLLTDDSCVWQYIDDWDELIFTVGEKIVLDDPEDLAPCPPCPQRDYRFTMVALDCWKYIPTGPPTSIHWTQIDHLQASAGSASCSPSWCVQGYGICCNPTTGIPEIIVNGARTHFGTTTCNDIPPNGYINPNTCYKFVTCD
jgi:hypothetical protein